MEAEFTANDGSVPFCLGHLNRCVNPIARRTRSASRQQRQANLRWHSTSGKCTSSPVEVTSVDDEHSHDPEHSAIKKSNKEPQLLQMVLSKPPANNHSPSSCLLSGHSTPPGESIHIVGETETPVNQDTLPNTVLPGNKKGETDPIKASKGNNDSSDNVSICTNQGPSRKVVTYFKRLPKNIGSKDACSQQSSLDEIVVQQEGMTLGLMMQPFNSLVESEVSFEERNVTLSKLNTISEHDVQSCVNELNELKSDYTKILEELEAIEAQKVEKRRCLFRMNSFLDESYKAIAEHEQKLEHLRQKRHKTQKEKEHEESKLSRLEEVERRIQKACDDSQQQLRNIMAKYWNRSY
ncbi:unnamed protein product [Urochloa decumbens]|uniref:Transforming acidic coiled-coil-containing protein C-terminal domain-containing protein n=1 Tax=Urochloa decumbens TaxID=240449 RepID=A0ABC9ATM7_9POAL